MTLLNKVAIITGAGSGIGRATALKMASLGAKIVATDIHEANAQETISLILARGGEGVFAKCDVTQARDVEAMVGLALSAYGKLDIAVNNAGVGGVMANATDVDEAQWDLVMNVNLKGVWLCMKYEIPAMLNGIGGSIVNVSSLAGVLGFRMNAPYAASKHGVIGLTKSVALEYARKNIRVNAVCPGFTETPMVATLVEEAPKMEEFVMKSSPMRRLGSVEEIADAIIYLADDSASFVNGHALVLDGGASIQ
ncbi:MAG: hypothetical protein CUN52_09345 [Phototrophicales bacterium]|nr:MAG: hypothetical protein CUN52_09345 [Phototrophicales bacterium]